MPSKEDTLEGKFNGLKVKESSNESLSSKRVDSLVHVQSSILPETEETSYSLLIHFQKWVMVVLLASGGFWSSIGSPVYYPALKKLEKEFDVDENLINITVVIYFIFQGVAPTVSGCISDKIGRRLVIIGGILIYVVVSIGLACAQSYGVIIFLRCLQSAGISPILAVSCGVVGDFTMRHERRTFVGAVSGLMLMGKAFGSLIGTGVTSTLGWRAIFWFLAIGCGVCMTVNFLLVVGSKRSIVGNLSIRLPSRNT